ncbi:MAG: hypothetical protein H0V44_05035, partial [Planctomycetes bacterium]|nr:hypothetical protein [Planctomycetota bacterium]
MSMTQATDDVYYLYVGNGWSGPFRLEQIKMFMRDKQIAPETFAYEPQQQMQLTVGQLLSAPAEALTGSFQNPSAPAETSKTASTGGRSASGRQKKQASGRQKVGTRGRRKDDEVIDLDAAQTRGRRNDDDIIDLDQEKTQTNKILDEDSFDLDAPKADSKTASRSKSQADEDSFDLDAATVDSRDDAPLTIEVDEPVGRAPDQRVSTQYAPQPGGENALEVVLSELESLRKAYNSLMEHSIKDREEGLRRVHIAQLAIGEVLDERKADIAEIRSLVAEIDDVASDLAKQHHDQALSTRIVRLRDSLHHSDVTKMVEYAEAVLRRIVEQTTQADEAKKTDDPFSAFESGAPEAPSHGLVVATARVELADKQNQLKLLKRTYDELQESRVAEQHQAREQLLKAMALLEAEKSSHEQDMAGMRSLAAEVYRLACELDPETVSETLSAQIISLWDELGNPTPTRIANVAGEVLIGLVKGLNKKVEKQTSALTAMHKGVPQQKQTSEVSALRKQVQELGSLRAEMLQTRTDLSMMRQREEALQEEKARLQGLLEEQRQISEKAQQAAKAREQRLRSTVCALEVTKELHQEVMRDLQTQLAGAQSRFEEMERELRDVRGTISVKKAASDVGQDIQEEMRRLVDMRAMLDARKEELSADLKTAEAELQRLGDGAQDEDPSIAEALAQKVNQLRRTYEQTQKRLDQQEERAQALQQQLDASRQEAGELRGRSDQLNTELESARTSLALSKKSVDELSLAYKRLESERESLLNELEKKKGTHVLGRSGVADETDAAKSFGEGADVLAQLSEITVRADNLDAELSRERRRVLDLTAAQTALHARVTELTQDRDQLRSALDRLTADRLADQQHHATAIAQATQNGLVAETRLAESRTRIEELEKRLRGSGPQPALSAADEAAARELAELRQSHVVASAKLDEARTAVSAAQAEA